MKTFKVYWEASGFAEIEAETLKDANEAANDATIYELLECSQHVRRLVPRSGTGQDFSFVGRT